MVQNVGYFISLIHARWMLLLPKVHILTLLPHMLIQIEKCNNSEYKQIMK